MEKAAARPKRYVPGYESDPMATGERPLSIRVAASADTRPRSKQVSSPLQSVVGAASTTSAKRLARIAGVFYLLVAIFGGFSQGVAPQLLYVAGDAAATAGNVISNPALVPVTVVAHLINAVFFTLTAVAFYLLLSHVHKHVARVMVIAVVLAAGIISVSAVFAFAASRVAADVTYVAAFGAAGMNALVLLLLDIEHYGILAAQVFFGLWLAPLGYLAYRSGLFPKALGVVLVVATASYLLDVLVAFLAPDIAPQAHGFLTIAPLVAEIWLLGYLLVKGVRSPRTAERTVVAPVSPMPA
jgi:hypothetical protein